jgi:hypothetical protein
MVSMKDDRAVTLVEEDIGRYAPQIRSYVGAFGATVTLENTPATYEQINHILEGGIETVTPSDASPLFTYAYTVAKATTEPTIKTYTWEYGDTEDAEEAEYCFVESFTLTGAPDGPVEVNAVWKGRQVTATSFTGAISLPAVEEILFNTGTLYIDDSGGSIGGTQVSGSFLEFTLNVTTGWQAITTGDGQLYFTFHKMTAPAITLEITAEHTSDWDSAGEKANWRNETVRLIRIQFTGTQSRQLTIDLAGLWTDFSALEDQDGDSVLKGSFTAGESTTDSLFAEFELVNRLSAVP